MTCSPPILCCLRYIDATYLAPADMYDGLQTASHMFVQHTISRFERVSAFMRLQRLGQLAIPGMPLLPLLVHLSV
jgi:hypothetical protein